MTLYQAQYPDLRRELKDTIRQDKTGNPSSTLNKKWEAENDGKWRHG